MKKTIIIVFVMLYLALNIETKKVSRNRSSGSGRSSSKKTNYNPQPAPTSFSYPQQSAPKPSLFGWQERPAQKTPSYTPKQPNPSNTGHSYPSSNTGLSGNNQPKHGYQENIHRNNAPNQQNSQRANSPNNQMGHNYPNSNGLSGSSGSGANYPQGSGLSGSNVAPAPYSGNNAGNLNRPQSGSNTGSGVGYPQGSGLSGSNAAPYGNNAPNSHYPQGGTNYPHNNMGNNYNAHPQGPPPPYSNTGNNMYHHPQGPPPPYSNNNYGHNYGGYGGPGGYGPQMPGYFGNYMNNNKGFGSVSRGGSALTGVGIAGAGIGTVLTGLALWNLARSTGQRHHTVIYDNRGQPVGVAPSNDTAPVTDPILGDLVNCTLSISNGNATEVIAIPCSIATSFTPEADVKDASMNNDTQDNTKCTVTVVTKAGREFMTTIPCSVLLNTAAQNNVTEPPLQDVADIGITPVAHVDQFHADQPSEAILPKINSNLNVPEPVLNCKPEEGEIRDPINPCFSIKHNLTVIPLDSTEKQQNA